MVKILLEFPLRLSVPSSIEMSFCKNAARHYLKSIFFGVAYAVRRRIGELPFPFFQSFFSHANGFLELFEVIFTSAHFGEVMDQGELKYFNASHI